VFRYNAGLYPDSANVYDSLGDGLDAAGRTEEAKASYEKAVEKGTASSDPNLKAYQANLDRIIRTLSERK
jgi:predicted negative regulator of RcsB-dependent stress response